MSNQLHRGEGDRRKQVKFRAGSDLVDEFDAMVQNSDEYQSRAEALRATMKRMLGDIAESDTPREPPADEELRTAYLTLVSLANYAGLIPHKIAINELSTRLGKSQELVERSVLAELRNRGYLAHKTTWNSSYRAWKLRGVDE
jgi:Arc/MetJ-type ribon-helix-helix transcriptional regulator